MGSAVNGFVLDCSVVMAWCFEDESDAYAQHVLLAMEETPALVPAIWPYEVANVMTIGLRYGRANASSCLRALVLFDSLPISIAGAPSVGDIRKLQVAAERLKLTSFDAAYVELAIDAGVPLSTLDGAQREAARRAGVKLFKP